MKKSFDPVRNFEKNRKSSKKTVEISNGVDKELYKHLGINELILLGIYSTVNNGEKCTFERLVRESFSLFPKAFCFPKNPEWPDSRKLDRPLRTLRKRKLIIGNPKTYFSLTKLGKKMAIEILKTFRQRKLQI